MKRKRSDLEKHWTKEIEQAPQEVIERLRFAFPELGDATLQTMAAHHPAVIRAREHFRQQLAACKRHRTPGGVEVIPI